MTEKFKKINRRYVLTDSTVNTYGFRLLTSGYQADEYRKNPIGYYMHRRDEGIALKWDDIQIEGDAVTAVPVINLSNARGGQTCDEVENGFLNAASVGHIVVLEYSTDPDLMLPGQTGPTVTKWYNKECSLVDIPGNGNALTGLYDAHENELNLADFTPVGVPTLKTEPLLAQLHEVLGLTAALPDTETVAMVAGLTSKNAVLQAECNALLATNAELTQQVNTLQTALNTREVDALLETALKDRKITVGLRNRLAADYATNATGLTELLAALPAYVSVTDMLQARNAQATSTWDDFERNDPTGKQLNDLRANDPARYQALFEAKFG